jgi:hypothetical protein
MVYSSLLNGLPPPSQPSMAAGTISLVVSPYCVWRIPNHYVQEGGGGGAMKNQADPMPSPENNETILLSLCDPFADHSS